MKKFLVPLLKLLIAAAIVAFLVVRNSDGLLAAFRSIHPGWLAGAFLLYGVHIYANAWRWHLLLRVRGIQCSMGEAFSLTMQSFFFSLVIPGGAIGGDLVRIGFLTARVPKEQKFSGAFTILMDRFTGMIGIFLVAYNVYSRAFAPYPELVNGSGSERVCGGKQHLLAAFFHHICYFCNRCGFPDSVDTNHKNHCHFPVFKANRLSVADAVAKNTKQRFFRFFRVGNPLIMNFIVQGIQNFHCCFRPDITADKQLLKLLKERISHITITAENRIDSRHECFFCFCQSRFEFIKKSHGMIPFRY